jgi:hypothetical protein
MSLNQQIKSLLKRGDVQRIADILKTSHQNVAKKLDAEKEIDSVDFINAVCQVTKKPFSYFKVVNQPTADMKATYKRMPGQPDSEKVENMAHEDTAKYWQQVNNEWKEKYEQAERLIKTMEQTIESKDELISQLRQTIEYMKKS